MLAQLDREFVAAARSRVLARALSYAMFEGRPVTTRGRWFNPIVFGHLRLASHAPLRDRVHRPVFILGMGRSGTTLLGRILAVHPAVGFLNEPKAMWHVVTPGEDIIGNYTEAPARLRLDAGHATPEMAATAHRMLSWYLWATRSERVVDKYPELVFRTGFVRALFPDAVFVVVVRRGWDTISSVARWSAVNGTAGADWWGVGSRKWRILWDQAVASDPELRSLAGAVDPETDDQITRATVEWIATMREAFRVRESLGEEVVLLRYEDLVADPESVIGTLLDRCGLARSNTVMEFARRVAWGAREPSPPAPALPRAISSAVETLTAELIDPRYDLVRAGDR